MKKVKAFVIKSVANDLISNQVDKYAEMSIKYFEPPYDLEQLQQMPQYSDILLQCIGAYQQNIVGFGIDLVKTSEEDDEAQLNQAKEFFDTCSPQDSFIGIMKKIIGDRERTGNAYLEVVRDLSGKIAGFYYAPAHTFRIGELSKEYIEVTIGGKTFRRKFNKYIQVVNGEPIYFKEFGDPRPMDKLTGEYKKTSMPASEIIHFKLDLDPTTPYGIPRYIGNIVEILGSRKAAELNYNYFLNGKHIPAAIVVQGGYLTQTSLDLLQGYVDDLKGTDNAFKYMILEAEPEEENPLSKEKASNVKIDIKPLTETLQNDALFMNYNKINRDKIRSSFRLPPLLTGESSDYNKATAETAYKYADEQVFQPERREIERVFNQMLKMEGITAYEMKFKSYDLSDPSEKVKALETFVTAGAATPNIATDIMSEYFGKKYEKFTQPWGDLPSNILAILANGGYVGTAEKFSKMLEEVKNALRQEEDRP